MKITFDDCFLTVQRFYRILPLDARKRLLSTKVAKTSLDKIHDLIHSSNHKLPACFVTHNKCVDIFAPRTFALVKLSTNKIKPSLRSNCLSEEITKLAFLPLVFEAQNVSLVFV